MEDENIIQTLAEVIEADTETRVAEIETNRRIAEMLQSLHDSFARTCQQDNGTVNELRKIREQQTEIMSGIRAILLYIAADNAEDRRSAAQYREQINGLVFGEKRSEKQSPLSPAQIRRELTDRVDEEELRTLCFDWGIDYDSLPGKGKAAKVRELVSREQRRDGVGRLRQWLETQKAPS
jgi:hypothetical protein